MSYFVFGILTNALCLCFYAVITFKDHPHCESKTGKTNVTFQIDFALHLGLWATCIDFIHTCFVEVIIRSRSYLEAEKFGMPKPESKLL